MASAAEQLAANLNFGTFAKATELKKRIWFTLGALIVFRLGTYIPVPGVDPAVMSQLMTRTGGGILGMFDMFSGGALGRMTVFGPEYHALHQRQHHHPADVLGRAFAGGPQEGG